MRRAVHLLSRRRWWFIVLVALLLAAAWYLYTYATRSATGEIVPPPPAQESQQSPAAAETLRGSYVSFAYPGRYTVVREGEDPNSLEQYRLSADPQPGSSKHLIVNIRRLPPGGLEEDSSYKYRHLHPETYRLQDRSVGGHPATFAWSRDDTELVVFVPTDSLLMTAAFTTTHPADQLEAEATQLLKSLRWHN